MATSSVLAAASLLLPVFFLPAHAAPTPQSDSELESQGGVAAGAEGPDKGGFKLGTGAIAGLSVAIGIAVIAIIGIWLLWFLAKKRQWEVRASLRRVSRRFTGKFADSKNKRQSNRGGVRMASPSAPKNRKRENKERDIEKAELVEGKGARVTTTVKGGR